MEIRTLSHDDLEPALDVRSRSFGPLASSNRERWQAMITLAIDEDRQLAAYDGGQVVALARINDFHQWWGGHMVPMSAVGGVTVAPEHRGRGVSGALMRAVLDRSHERGHAITTLYPATVAPYHAVGYELGGVRLVADLSAEALRGLGRADRAALRRPIPVDGPSARKVADTAFEAGRHHGPFTWPDHQWIRDLEEDDFFAYLADDGFVGYEFADGRIDVQDIAASSSQTARTLWSLVGSASGVAPVVRATISPSDPVFWMLPSSAIEVHQLERWMIRLLNPVAAVAGRGFPVGLEASIPVRLDDPILGTGGSYVLEVSGGRGELVPVDADDGVRLGPRASAALFAGVPCDALRAAGIADGGDPALDPLLDAAFAASPWMNGYF